MDEHTLACHSSTRAIFLVLINVKNAIFVRHSPAPFTEEFWEVLLTLQFSLLSVQDSKEGVAKGRAIAAVHEHVLFRAVSMYITIKLEASLSCQGFYSFFRMVYGRMTFSARICPVAI